MKIITLHCDYIKFESLKKAIQKIDDTPTKGEVVIKETLVVLTAVEKGDSEATLSDLIASVEKTAQEVKTDNIVLYPYAHLSSNLASPEFALETLKKAEKLLAKNFKVTRAPFGFYKSFELKCKGHPLSELSKTFTPEESSSQGNLIEEKFDVKQLLREISRSRLDTRDLKDNDHRILGQKLDLFSFNEAAPGAVFWHHNGWVIYNELLKFAKELQKQADYQEIATPEVLDKKLWQISGHWEKYKDNIFLTDYEKRQFAVKPMNCPGGMLVFKTGTKSYKDLPLRVAEFGTVHRQELSGVLAGLFRVIKFTQDDAHIFCTEDQLEKEIVCVMNLAKTFYKQFGLKYNVELSTRPEKRIGSDEIWDRAEKILANALKKEKMKYKTNKGDGAFYGPKIDFHVQDSLKRTWQLGTIQLDFAMPERFELEYIGADNARHRPIMLHRAIFGSLERFIGILLEHTTGSLPLWLAPIQTRVISFTDRNAKSVEKLIKDLKKQLPELRIDTDTDSTTVNDKIRKAELAKIPYIIVIGDKEEEAKTLAVRKRGEKPKFGVKQDKLIEELKGKIENRS